MSTTPAMALPLPLPPRTLATMGLAADLPVTRLGPLPAGHEAAPATTRVWDEADVPRFLRSSGIEQLQRCVTRLSRAALGQATLVLPEAGAQEQSLPASVRVVAAMLRMLRSWIALFPPRTDAQRFGNLAFRDYGRHVEAHAAQLHRDWLPPELHPYIPELAPYLVASLGSFVRIDYGTGHELAFLAWLAFLARLGLWDTASDDDSPMPVRETDRLVAVYLVPLYLQLVWALQDTYRLEPAGSHGAWGLDDYCFVPYILGSAQLAGAATAPGGAAGLQPGAYTPRLIPDGMHKPPSVASARSTSGPRPIVPPEQLLAFLPMPAATAAGAASSEGPPFANLFSSAVARIQVLKRGPFNEHSPLLWDLSGTVPSWTKMYTGMRKMWTAEVLGKLPVVQHFLFGEHAYPWPGPQQRPAHSPTTHPGAGLGTGTGTGTGTRPGALPDRGLPTHAQSHPSPFRGARAGLHAHPHAPSSHRGPRLAAPTRPSAGTQAPWALRTPVPPPAHPRAPAPRLPPASTTFVGSAAPAPRPSSGTQAPWATRTPRPMPPDEQGDTKL